MTRACRFSYHTKRGMPEGYKLPFCYKPGEGWGYSKPKPPHVPAPAPTPRSAIRYWLLVLFCARGRVFAPPRCARAR